MMEKGVTYDIGGCICMTYGASQRGRESGTSQSCARLAAAVRRTARGGGAVGTGSFDLPATGVSLPATSAAAARASAGEGSEAGVYGQAAAQFDTASAAIRPWA